jgi:3-phenylpropionate/trans-cinnamate dioxygenase ferredoxin subunit
VEFVRVGTEAEIPEGEVRGYELPSGHVAVAHVEFRLFAFDDECTHAGCRLSDGQVDERAGTIRCACHDSVFDVETGEPTDGPARDPVRIHAVRVVDGWVEVSPGPPGPG